ncbi:hypothetical protein AXK11_04855 [Cephaloticoccus primus]|uniref:Glycosyl transferase family 1 domain-containing protein n=1 Tax=Cephaloticoccus primus TaxID=1548207 RepID=A0A139SMP6_9BACT|nr:glycosyltransferase [Cephaloticoccus primus]KXU35867.1 hypothetical protein AXK11_04855 [Cephaloticoccus primus]
MRIWYDCTKSARAAHRSGLQRVAGRLRDELGAVSGITVLPSSGLEWAEAARAQQRERGNSDGQDWFLTPEVFAPAERPGFAEILAQRPCPMAAIFYDAIPLKIPHVTWPASVARHPAYMKMLASFDLVLAISEASRRELLEYWDWMGLEKRPPVRAISLGADFDGSVRISAASGPTQPPVLLCVGILEPRKNQTFLLEQVIQKVGADFEPHFVGRMNPHFGKPIAAQLARAARASRASGWCRLLRRVTGAGRKGRSEARVYYHKHLSDEALVQLYARATATLFPTIAEGCGLPVLESLWRGLPCLCSDLPSIREIAAGGGALLLPPNGADAWARAIREIAEGGPLLERLQHEARARPLPTWATTAQQVVDELGACGAVV